MSMLRQGLRFLVVGLLNTGAGVTAMYALMLLAGASPAWANALGYAVGFALSFALHRAWTFGCTQPASLLLPGYLAAVAVCYACNLAAVMAAISILHMNPFAAQLVGVAVYTPLLFALSRSFVFRPRPHATASQA